MVASEVKALPNRPPRQTGRSASRFPVSRAADAGVGERDPNLIRSWLSKSLDDRMVKEEQRAATQEICIVQQAAQHPGGFRQHSDAYGSGETGSASASAVGGVMRPATAIASQIEVENFDTVRAV